MPGASGGVLLQRQLDGAREALASVKTRRRALDAHHEEVLEHMAAEAEAVAAAAAGSGGSSADMPTRWHAGR